MKTINNTIPDHIDQFTKQLLGQYESRHDVPGYDKTPDWDYDEKDDDNHSEEYLNDETNEKVCD